MSVPSGKIVKRFKSEAARDGQRFNLKVSVCSARAAKDQGTSNQEGGQQQAAEEFKLAKELNNIPMHRYASLPVDTYIKMRMSMKNVLNVNWSPEEEPLGEGSFGVVVKAKSSTPGEEKEYALKLVSSRTIDESPLKRWKYRTTRERNIIRKIQGTPHVVEYFGSTWMSNHLTQNPCYFILKTEILSQSLQSCIEELGSFEEHQLEQVYQQGATGLAWLHDRGIVHHDIKPDNFMFRFTTAEDKLADRMLNGTLVFVDFGLAKEYPKTEELQETKSCGGTRFYQSFAKAQGDPFDPYVEGDCYSFGVTLLEATFGYAYLKKNMLKPEKQDKNNNNNAANTPTERQSCHKMPAFQIAANLYNDHPSHPICQIIHNLLFMPKLSYLGIGASLTMWEQLKKKKESKHLVTDL